jgi:L-threonylcarbamoyladenylate synthase
METELLQAEEPQALARAAELLRAGRIVAFPTETVYGLGVRADDSEAVAELRRIKRRPEGKPFSLLVADPEDAERWGVFDARARAVAEKFWPGPLTMVVPDGEGGTVGLRCPDHDVARGLVRLVGAPLAAPSANLSGNPPARTAREALASFRGRIAAVLDGGETPGGRASTVVSLCSEELEILRPGPVTEQQLRAALKA